MQGLPDTACVAVTGDSHRRVVMEFLAEIAEGHAAACTSCECQRHRIDCLNSAYQGA